MRPVGLEQRISTKGLLEAHSNRKIVIQSVLSEQHRQRSFGFQDPNQIAILSVQLSAEAFEGAQKRGKFQEMAKFVWFNNNMAWTFEQKRDEPTRFNGLSPIEDSYKREQVLSFSLDEEL